MKNYLYIRVAPPGAGKTQGLKEAIRQIPQQPILFLSPLRALAREVYLSFNEEFKCLYASSKKEFYKNRLLWVEKKYQLFILTPEVIDLKLPLPATVLVLDEFHLWHYWGLEFRPVLWEALYLLASSCPIVLGLTATLPQAFETYCLEHFKAHFDELILSIDKNQSLKNRPQKIHFFPPFLAKEAILTRFAWELKGAETETFLVFCEYRQEVKALVAKLKSQGLAAIGCVGGEAETFYLALEACPRPRCLVATTAISHGVNLPSISKIFFNYRVKNLDFWIQMAGRGGRKGEAYEVYTWDRFLMSKWEAFFGGVKTLWFHWALSLFFGPLFLDRAGQKEVKKDKREKNEATPGLMFVRAISKVFCSRRARALEKLHGPGRKERI